MKKMLVFYLVILSGIQLFAQTEKTNQVDVNSFVSNSNINMLPVKNSINKDLKGSYYLFNNWNNYAVVYSGSKALKLRSFNYNLYKDLAEFQISKDSVYSFKSVGIDSLIVNNRLFKPLQNNIDDSSFVEILFETEEIVFYKSFNAEIKKQKMNPITGEYDFPDEIEVEENYYLGRNVASADKINLKKNQVTKALEEYEDEMKKIAKENDLSFKKESDLIKILKILAI